MRLRLPGGRRLAARGGIHDDGRPAANFRLTGPTGQGATAYTGFAVTADGPWSGQGVSSVSGARQVVMPGVAVYAESRVDAGDVLPGAGLGAGTAGLPSAGAPTAGDAVGGTLAAGAVHLGLAYERARRLDDPAARVRDAVHGQAGLVLPGLSVSAFGEVTRTPALAGGPFERQWAAGLTANGSPTRTLALGGAFEIERTPLDPGPGLRGVADVTWRPDAAPVLALHYGLRQDRRAGDGLRHRTQLGRLTLVAGGLPGPELTVVGRLAVDEVLDAPPLRTAARAAVVEARLGWPVWRLEPALELGVRRVWGARLDPATDPTARLEVTVRAGTVRVGIGGVLAGFAGTGLETTAGDPVPPRIYLVLRGTL